MIAFLAHFPMRAIHPCKAGKHNLHLALLYSKANWMSAGFIPLSHPFLQGVGKQTLALFWVWFWSEKCARAHCHNSARLCAWLQSQWKHRCPSPKYTHLAMCLKMQQNPWSSGQSPWSYILRPWSDHVGKATFDLIFSFHQIYPTPGHLTMGSVLAPGWGQQWGVTNFPLL